MMDTHLDTRRILIFLAFAFGIAWTGGMVLRLTVGVDDLATALLLTNWIFVLWVPALANVATRLITKEGWGHLMLRPKFRRRWRFYLAAWLLPLLAVCVGGSIFYLLLPQSFDSTLGEMRKQLASLPPLATWAVAANPWAILLAQTLIIMLANVPIFTVISFGEEFGWRAYLLPKLVKRFASASADDPACTSRRYAAAARKAALLIGVIWGVWHWPGRLLYDPGASILFELVYLVSSCCLSVLLCWVTLRSGSVWPAAVGHGTYNLTIGLAMGSLKGPVSPLLGPMPAGLIGGIGFTALALVLLFSRRAFARQEEAGSDEERAVAGAQRVEPLA